MNIFKKYCPNVFVAQCEEAQTKGETIILTTKYGKEVECIVFNYLGTTRENKKLYSIVRADGYNTQERAKAKAEKLNGYAGNAEKRSNQAWEASKEGKDFLSLGEPIKVGHHSEKRHRALIQRNWDRMDKSRQEKEKAEDYKRRAEYWESKANDINLSMPESLEYYEYKLQEAKDKHKFLKDNPEKRAHSFSLTYAKKDVNTMQKNLDTAVKLWGSEEEIKQVDEEKKEKAEAKARKRNKTDEKIDNLGGFFAFNNDQFKKGINKIKESGHLEEGEKVTHITAGLYIPSKNVDAFLK
tara:strand:+ start:9692 stop:10582 length:891 start_codon:yes stop_codon:yes gene_type:complete